MSGDTYRTPPWLPGGHLQTIWGVVAPRPAVDYRRERWELPDGDFLDLDWVESPPDAPLVVLFHGLEGSSDGHYARALMAAVHARDWRGVVVHFRGCSGEPNRLPRAYHAGDSTEIGYVLNRLRRDHPGRQIHAVGVSLGGNALLKWLGEQGEAAEVVVRRAAAIGAPLDLPAAGAALDRGFNRVYAARFLKSLKRKALDKLDRFPGLYDRAALEAIDSILGFDDLVTAPLHGFRDAEEYWTRSASKPWLKHIRVPTLVLNARNDPFLPAEVLPSAAQVSDRVTLDQPEAGGHVGFVGGWFPGHLNWLPGRVLGFLETDRGFAPRLRAASAIRPVPRAGSNPPYGR
ncbi:MAG TPA: hydrolase [Thiobacillaceae bacterium]|nr:hydrolase [Thiobacillaceae bacterium]